MATQREASLLGRLPLTHSNNGLKTMLHQTIERYEPTIEEWVFAEEESAIFDAKLSRGRFNFLQGKSRRYIQAFLGEIERQCTENQPVDWTEF